jgi:hypothetical protein
MGVFGALFSSVFTEKVFHSGGMDPVSMKEILLGQQELRTTIRMKNRIAVFISP